MLFRAQRRAIFAETLAKELSLERNEGQAEDTGIRLCCGLPLEGQLTNAAKKLEHDESSTTIVRSFANATGPLAGGPSARKQDYSFDFNQIVPPAGGGSVYGTVRILEEWGILGIKLEALDHLSVPGAEADRWRAVVGWIGELGLGEGLRGSVCGLRHGRGGPIGC